MAREQTRKRASSDGVVSRRRYLRLSGAAAVGASIVTVSESDTPGNVLSIVGTTAEATTYEVTVTREIVPGPGTDALSVLGTTGRSAEDAIGDGIRRYHFTGEITDLRIGEGATAFVNGAAVSPTTRK